MDTSIEKKKFNKRAFLSILLLISGSILPVSGIMNHELQFETMTPARHFWMSVHNMAALIFLLSAIMHVSMNWRSLLHYIKKSGGALLSREALAAIVVVTGIVSLFAQHAFHIR